MVMYSNKFVFSPSSEAAKASITSAVTVRGHRDEKLQLISLVEKQAEIFVKIGPQGFPNNFSNISTRRGMIIMRASQIPESNERHGDQRFTG